MSPKATAIAPLLIQELPALKINTTYVSLTEEKLELGKPIKKEISGDEVHSYQLTLQAGQYLRVIVEQQGVDLVATLYEINNRQLTRANSPNSTQGIEPITIIAQTTGAYQLEVRRDKEYINANTGRYQVQIEELREPTEQDQRRIVGERVFMEGNDLAYQGTDESRKAALTKYSDALFNFRLVDDRYLEAYTLFSIGSVYRFLKEKDKALEYLNQALPLFRSINETAGEAFTLRNIATVYHYNLK